MGPGFSQAAVVTRPVRPHAQCQKLEVHKRELNVNENEDVDEDAAICGDFDDKEEEEGQDAKP